MRALTFVSGKNILRFFIYADSATSDTGLADGVSFLAVAKLWCMLYTVQDRSYRGSKTCRCGFGIPRLQVNGTVRGTLQAMLMQRIVGGGLCYALYT